MIESVIAAVSFVGTAAATVNSVVGLISKLKGPLSKEERRAQAFQPSSRDLEQFNPVSMNPFQAQMQDPYAGGGKWVADLQRIASAQTGNSWVPRRTEGILGIDLTGIWAPPLNPMWQDYIRQFGPYINVIEGIGATPTSYGEGILNPMNGAIFVVGRNIAGLPISVQGQLLPNWVIQGMVTVPGPFGQPVTQPFLIQKLA